MEGRLALVSLDPWGLLRLNLQPRSIEFRETQTTASAYRTVNTTILAITAAADALTATPLAAGRKASTYAPWGEDGRRGAVPADEGGWTTVAPSPIPFGSLPAPRELETAEVAGLAGAFAAAASRAVAAGFDLVEVHAAHGYLLHQFLSPLSNRRTDHFGGDLAGRMRLPLAVVDAVRRAWPAERPLFVRVSATDWVEGGWTLAESVVFAKELGARGVDLVDVSSGGTAADASVPVGPKYQVPLAAEIRRQAGIPVGAVGLLETPEAAAEVLAGGDADAVFVGRPMLRDPYWSLRAPDAPRAGWPVQYHRAI